MRNRSRASGAELARQVGDRTSAGATVNRRRRCRPRIEEARAPHPASHRRSAQQALHVGVAPQHGRRQVLAREARSPAQLGL
eukprot:9360220-Alexandrium_andersonii.AAC.1